VQAWRRQALFALSNSTQVLLEPQLSLAWRPDHGTGGRIQLPFLVQCFTLAGTNKNKGFLVLARRKPQRYRVVSRGLATPPGPKRRFLMCQIA
jgi:hypothetical protein